MSKENWHFHHLGTKRSSQYQEKGLGKRLVCNLRLTLSMICLYRKMRHKRVRYESFLFPVCFRIVVLFAVVFEIVTQGVCLCVTTPRATSRKIAPFNFIRDNYFLVDFVPEKHLFVAYFASKCLCIITLIQSRNNLLFIYKKKMSRISGLFKGWSFIIPVRSGKRPF